MWWPGLQCSRLKVKDMSKYFVGRARIFVVGLPKAGTSSLHTYLSKSGIKSCHQTCRKNNSEVIPTFRICDNASKNQPLLAGFDFVDAFTQLDWLLPCNKDLKCATCWPQLTLIPLLDKQYPGSKFILNTRNISNHVSSIMRWGNLAQRIQKNNVPFFSMTRGTLEDNLAAWITSHNDFVRHFFFNSNDFVEIDIENSEEAALSLNNFLGVNTTWPHSNSNT